MRSQQNVPAPPELPRSSLGTRVAAHLIDWLVFLSTLVTVALPAGLLGFGERTNVGIALGFLIGPFALGVLQCWLIHDRAQSLGKLMLEIRLSQLDGTPPGLLRVVFLRNVVPMLIAAIPLLGVVFAIANVVMLFRHERRSLQDRIAGTIVVDAPEPVARIFAPARR